MTWNDIASDLTPVALSLEANVGYEAGVATSTSLAGVIFVTRGKDRFKFKGFTSVGVGGGVLGISATANGMAYFYFGDINNFDLTTFEGSAYDIEVTAGEGVIGGGIISVAPNVNHPGEYLIGVGGIIGFGAGSPVSGSATWQMTTLW